VSRKERVRLFLDSDVLTTGMVSTGGPDKAVLSLCAARTCRLVLAEAVRDEVKENLLFRPGGLEDETADRVLRDYDSLIALLKPELVPRPGPAEVRVARRLIPHAADVPVLLSAIAARPDWFLTRNTQRFTPAVARRTGLRFATPDEFFRALSRSISQPHAGARNGPAEPVIMPVGSRKSTRDAAVYVMVCPDEAVAEVGVSFEEQMERAEAYLQAAGLRCRRSFTEQGISRVVPLDQRPMGACLLEMIRKGQVRHVVTLRLDRLFRSAADAVRRMSEWEAAGVVTHLIDLAGQPTSTGSAVGRMILAIGDTLVRLDRHRIAESTARALADRKRMRIVYGPTPYGCERIGRDISLSMNRRGRTWTDRGERGTDLVAHPRERVVLEHMREARADGMTLRQIADMLNDLQIPCKRGGAKWYPATVKRILENDISLPEDLERLT
jgi:DNA invertase Pin-like site-specific DNA recombinase